MTGWNASLRRQIFADREVCEKVFDIEIHAQNAIELVEFLTDAAVRGDDEFVKLPTAWAAAAVLVVKGVVKRPANRPTRSAWRKRQDRMSRIHKHRPVDDEMILWTRQRQREIRSEAKTASARITADEARDTAAKEAKARFGSLLSEQEIAARSRRPRRYARSETQPRESRH